MFFYTSICSNLPSVRFPVVTSIGWATFWTGTMGFNPAIWDNNKEQRAEIVVYRFVYVYIIFIDRIRSVLYNVNMERRFNVTGLCIPEEDYMVDISGKIAQIRKAY